MLILTIAEGRVTGPSERSRVVYRTNTTIGRHEINDWVLPDPDRYLSGRHCVIAYRAGECARCAGTVRESEPTQEVGLHIIGPGGTVSIHC